MKKVLHPKMAQRAQLVKAAHAELGKQIPGFHQRPAAHRMQAVQAHVTKQLGKAR